MTAKMIQSVIIQSASTSEQLVRTSRLPKARILLRPIRTPRGYITLRIRPQWEFARGNCALPRSSRHALDETRVPRMMPLKGWLYCGEPTQTATKGVFAALGTGPQDAPLSLRNCAGLRVAPQ